uniref:Uncharacterized protein n=1 Tax=Timema douglasi TaxID=61478 RepID=A0A7R8VFV9_TIMDO|nr:unnamed protein product [Timema douglasi]
MRKQRNAHPPFPRALQEESDMNGIPSLTLPSISEDDENIPEEGETSPLSPANRSPLHTAISPRHAKFNPRTYPFSRNSLSGHLHEVPAGQLWEAGPKKCVEGVAAKFRVEELRCERVGRGRSGRGRSGGVNQRTGSLEGLNLELRGEVEQTRSSVERLDTQVSSLHHDVATLSQEVRNAIQALQELATSNTTMATRYPYPVPAHSNPNLPDNSLRNSHMPLLQRSSSHPPDMFCWNDDTPLLTSHLVDRETQTDLPVEMMEQFVLQNPRRVLLLLGLEHDPLVSALSCASSGSDHRAALLPHSNNNIPPQDRSDQLHSAVRQAERLPCSWLSGTTEEVHPPHRFSTGDVEDKLPEIRPLPSTRSLIFNPFNS